MEQILEVASPKKSSYMVTCLPSLKPFKSDEQDMCDTAGEERVSFVISNKS